MADGFAATATQAFVTFFVTIDPIGLIASGWIGRMLGPTLVTMLSRLLGLLLAALAVQQVIDGLREAFLA
jgi:multiple antibiotic resistance protein